jgi:thioredoxin:protein disulfide reductase
VTRCVLRCAVFMAAATVAAAQGNAEFKLSAVAGQDAIPAGGEGRVALAVDVPEGLHVNSNAPLEDFLIKTELTLDDHDAIESTAIAYAEPEVKKFGFSEEPMSVYEGAFLIGVALSVSENAVPGDIELTGSLRYQACDDEACYAPKTVPVTLPVTIADAGFTATAANEAQFAKLPFPAMGKEENKPAPVQFGGEGKGERVTGEVLREFNGVRPGESLRIALTMNIAYPFHTNSNEPLEDFLRPTKLTIEAPDGFTVAEVAYPQAEIKTFSFSDEPMAVYEGTVTIGAIVDAGELGPGEHVLNGTLEYQACDDELCYAPVTERFEIPIRVFAEDEEPTRLTAADIFDAIAFTGEIALVETQPGETATAAAETGDWEELLPRFEILAEASGFMPPDEFIAFIDGAESGEGYSQSGLEGQSIWYVLAAAIIGGLLLNLTPCVLPVIPINLAIIGAGVQGMKEGSTRGRGFALGGTYGLGIAAVFGVLGLIVVLGLGTFGAINSNWWFSAGIAALFIVMALAMFDVIVIDFSKFQNKLGLQQSKGSFAFAFIMGGVSALLAGACVAPVLIAVLLYSQDLYAKGNAVGIALPFVLGLGMALPWPFAGSGMSFLPKPGMWMVRIKQAMGVFILGFALFYAWLGFNQFSNIYLVDEEAVLASAQQADEDGWVASLGGGLAAAQAEDKMVLIDFWATWCKNCLTMNKTTLKDEQVLARLEDYVKIKYQAEQPDASPHQEVIAHFDQYVGLPHYAILKPVK